MGHRYDLSPFLRFYLSVLVGLQGKVEVVVAVIRFSDQFSDTYLPFDKLPALIILDLNMPLLNGTETLTAIKGNNQFKHIPTVIFSTSTKAKTACIDLGAAGYFTKPNRYQDSVDIAKHFCQLAMIDLVK